MSGKVRNPNETSKGFLWAIIALVVIAIAIIGYVIFAGQQAQANKYSDREVKAVAFQTTITDGAVQLKSDKAKSDATPVDLYEDFSCSYCAQLANDTDAQMKTAIEEGKIVVNIRNMKFLDRDGVGHSTYAGTAAYTIVKDDKPEIYWAFRDLLMQEQQELYGTDLEGLAQIAGNLGASDETVTAITEGKYQDEYISFAEKNESKLETDTGTVSSPRVIIDGQEVEGEAMYSWTDQFAS